MTKTKRKLTDYQNLTEYRKDKILEHIRIKEVSIKSAALKFGLTVALINKIFTERFGKRDQKMDAIRALNLNK